MAAYLAKHEDGEKPGRGPPTKLALLFSGFIPPVLMDFNKFLQVYSRCKLVQ